MTFRVGISQSFDRYENIYDTYFYTAIQPDYSKYSCFEIYDEESTLNMNVPKIYNRRGLLNLIEQKDLSLFFQVNKNMNITSESAQEYLIQLSDNSIIYPIDIIVELDSLRNKNLITTSLNYVQENRLHQGRSKILIESNYRQNNSNSHINSNDLYVDNLRQLFESIDNSSHFGVSLNTSYLYSYGINKLNKYDSVQDLFEEINSISKIGCIHLTDSKQFNERSNISFPICTGNIWNQDKEGLVSIIDFASERRINNICRASDEVEGKSLDQSISIFMKEFENY